MSNISCIKPIASDYYPSQCLEKSIKKDTCLCLNMDIEYLFQKYEISRNIQTLEKANIFIDSSLKYCSQIEEAVLNKFRYFNYLKDFKGGIVFCQSIDSSKLSTPYLKKYIVNSFQLKLADSSDLIKINSIMLNYIEEHLNKFVFDNIDLNSDFTDKFQKDPIAYCFSDLNSVRRYFVIKSRIVNRDEIKKQLNDIKIDTLILENKIWNESFLPTLINNIDCDNNPDYILK